MKMLASMCLVVVLGVVGSAAAQAKPHAAPAARPRVIQAVRADAPPVLDGKLDDPCWQKTKPATGFLTLSAERPASVDSFGYMCYDDAHLYIGTKYTMPKGLKPKGTKRPHDSYVFGDDLVEIMLDPGRTRSDYYQLAINAYGSTYDSARRRGGTQNDKSWDGEWASAAHIADGYWSLEMAIPFHNLGISPEVGSTWGINICRTMIVPYGEQSSIGVRGVFNSAKGFAVVEGLDVDFSRYLLQIGDGDVRLAAPGDKPTAAFRVPVKNLTGKAGTVKIECFGKDGVVASETVSLGAGETATPAPELVDLDLLLPGRTDTYIVRSAPKTRKVVVSDAKDGTTLAVSLARRPWFCEAMWIETRDPWRRETPAQKSGAVSLTIHTRLDSKLRSGAELVVELLRREDGEVLAVKRLAEVHDRNDVAFSTEDIEWGAYDVRASCKGAGGPIAAAQSVATVLPGGKHHVKVLNNLVSELMNAKDRGLPAKGEVPFMNPRKGWVYVSASGDGSVTLGAETEPMIAVTAGKGAVEAFRHLPAGRHTLRVSGAFDHLIVRAVPQLIYSANPTRFEPDVMAEALTNANTFLGGTREDAFMREWVASGKRWITFAGAPSHRIVEGLRVDESYVSADEYYQQLTSHPGFAHPLISGVMVDQISAAAPRQKTAIVAALARLAARDEFAGKEYSPWYEGAVFGSDAERAVARFVVDQGWAFSWYQYLAERPTVAEARAMIRPIVDKAVACQAEYPASLRRAVITLGYMSHAPTGISQDCDPSVDFKVLMQMQMETLANDPGAFGVYGLLWYYSPYVNEEYLRWAGRLFRHFGIEGETAPLTTDPYVLTHITNGDFEQGTEGWTIEEPEPGTVGVQHRAAYGSFQNRYQGGTKGDTFLLMRRSVKGANKFSQEIRDLKPGRLYSMRMITADYGNITGEKSVKQRDAVSIRLDGAETVDRPGKNRQEPFESKHYGGQITKSRPAWLNFHWYVFRAKTPTARLTVSDWAGPGDPGGPAGQELMYNFIEVQPYLE